MSVSGFITRSACRGRRPSQLASYAVRSRPTLVAQLLKSRTVARFIVAPSGYGKTCLALEYSETMHSWSHTFWISAQSPCFVRELDAEALAAYVFELDPEASLVVFDALPQLGLERQQRLSREIDTLLSEGCEVVITCVPAYDMSGSLQLDRLRIGAADLLLSDEELDEVRTADERSRKPSEQMEPAFRVPLLIWSVEPDKGAQFAKGTLAEEMPADFLFVASSALVLQKGNLADIVSLGSFDQQVFEEMSADYPHLGYDSELGLFEAPKLSVEDLCGPVRSRSAILVNRSSCESFAQITRTWADLLLDRSAASRACEVIQQICPYNHRAPWVVGNGAKLMRKACFVSTLQLVASQSSSTGELRMRLDVLEALCRRFLGDEEGALNCAKKGAFNEKVPEDVRSLSLLLTARANGGAISQRACAILRERESSNRQYEFSRWSKWELLEEAFRVAEGGMEDLAILWARYQDAGVEDDVLYLCASWLFNMHDDIGRQFQQRDLMAARRAERFIRERLRESPDASSVNYFLTLAGLALEKAGAFGYPIEGSQIESASLYLLSQVDIGVRAQRRYFAEETRMEAARHQDWMATHPTMLAGAGPAVAPDVPERTIPLLSLKMFGSFEAAIGGKPLAFSNFSRQSTRALLVLLAVNQGREISRDSAAEAMWPTSSISVARKNFYAVWSRLRKALSLPDGTCPYLIRHRFGCSLDDRYVQSDVKRFNEVCRELLFGAPNIDHWSLLFSEIDRDFACDLMPAEVNNKLIIQARNDYRARMVDALVAATMSVIALESPQWGVWFARAAVERDDTREDAYVALMRAQIANNQRTAAMMTFLKCRRVLSDKLGIDPSPETTALYESLLDSN